MLAAQSWLTLFNSMDSFQPPLSMGFSKKEYWSGEPFPSPADLPNSEIKPDLLCSRQILYHLCHQESPNKYIESKKKLEYILEM